jgi:hypothetical protein
MCRREHSLARLVLLGIGLLLAGCGAPGGRGIKYPETGATLEGTVTYGKDKIVAALVIAQNDSGSTTAFVDDDGHYKLQNVPLGEVSIGVDTEAGKGQAMGKIMARSQGKADAAPRLIDVPKQFADPLNSGIKTTIQKGENQFDIVIPR